MKPQAMISWEFAGLGSLIICIVRSHQTTKKAHYSLSKAIIRRQLPKAMVAHPTGVALCL
eukprot:scaffold546169_cov34-Prasinocladus_malaysianus.AAC.1